MKTAIKDFFDRFSVKKLHDDLEYWIFIQCGDDILTLRDQRKEYQHLVKQNQVRCIQWINGQCASVIQNDDIPNAVLADLARELKLPWWKRPTFWVLVKLNIKRWFTWRR